MNTTLNEQDQNLATFDVAHEAWNLSRELSGINRGHLNLWHQQQSQFNKY